MRKHCLEMSRQERHRIRDSQPAKDTFAWREGINPKSKTADPNVYWSEAQELLLLSRYDLVSCPALPKILRFRYHNQAIQPGARMRAASVGCAELQKMA